MVRKLQTMALLFCVIMIIPMEVSADNNLVNTALIKVYQISIGDNDGSQKFSSEVYQKIVQNGHIEKNVMQVAKENNMNAINDINHICAPWIISADQTDDSRCKEYLNFIDQIKYLM